MAFIAASYIYSCDGSDLVYGAYFGSTSQVFSNFDTVAKGNSSNRNVSYLDPTGGYHGSMVVYTLTDERDTYYYGLFYGLPAHYPLCKGIYAQPHNIFGGITLTMLSRVIVDTTGCALQCPDRWPGSP